MSSDRIAQIIDGVIRREGGFVDHPDDRGGATRYGITAATARSAPWGYDGLMENLPRSLAELIYRHEYVIEPGFDEILEISELVAIELVDTGVLMGPGTASRYLQRALNIFNRRGSLWSEIKVDGQCGPVTRRALQALLSTRAPQGEHVLIRTLNGLQLHRLFEIAEGDPSQESFVFGQILHRT